ncbi:MAG: hypothetical protein H2172_08480 [Opitutus sp.]|nr:hypothetical protein [Opitutus sp.]MCS6246557.1 hypothetical protein [Opitutus sp.]MCS6272758.1 hypothetical protein [Opitutus sp.]MCS6276390.1 hypothetical protein [Opitutus sp.]MCS6301962.1 hypothetical protein [Opitutus sp.]
MINPVPNGYRSFTDLSGVWDFQRDTDFTVESLGWFREPLLSPIRMPVTANFNDIGRDVALRYPVGDVC